jgi:hypothetical protein
LNAERIAAIVAALLLIGDPAAADVFASGDFLLRAGTEPGTYELTARLPELVATQTGLEWPQGCVQTESRQRPLGNRTQLLYRARCDRPLGRGDVIRAPWRLDGARLTVEIAGARTSAALPRTGEGVVLPIGAARAADRGWAAVAPAMLWQGVLHIWLGWDHLAFVLCLCMIAGGWRLPGLVTSFTLGHSLSLGLAFFDVVTIPVPPTEALIALSIVLVARECLLARDPATRPESSARAAVVVTVFGLVHGLGFATALRELGISAGERWPALLFFNVGVEAGQVVFVAAVLGLLAALRGVAIEPAARRVAAYASGIIGFFWLVERVAAYGW